ncbi:MAG: hypothetical protein JXB17_13765 [Bacteroidales bacterium]|nr:hypothetical protein [Bacteroidales bacterium]
MRFKIVSILHFLIVYLSAFVSAQEVPEWVENKGFSPWISENQYVTGFGISSFTKKDDVSEIRKIAEENAKKNLSEKISVSIKAKTTSIKQQTGNEFEQKLKSEVVSMSDIELLGLKKEFYTDTKTGMEYCFIYVPKAQLIKSYEYKIFEKNKELESIFYAAKENESNGYKDIALESYLKCSPILSEIKHLQTVLLGLGQVPEQEILIDIFDLHQCINRLVTTINSINDLAFFIAYAFKEQTQGEVFTGVIVSPITYRNTGMSSEFSKQLRESVEHQLVTFNKWETHPIKKYEPTYENMVKIRYGVKGTYWETDDKITVNIYLNEILTGIKKASIEYQFSRAITNEEFAPLKPNNYEKAKNDQEVFNSNEIISNGISLDVFTNKGKDDLIFTEGEKMKVFIKTNIPCYIQLIYHLSDSSRILFLNNELMDVDKINRIYELPFVFICSAPFGVETLQVNASEKPFPKIDTYTKDGLIYINENLPSILEKSRETDITIFQAEKRLTITTMPN